jgi:hypothetical protein
VRVIAIMSDEGVSPMDQTTHGTSHRRVSLDRWATMVRWSGGIVFVVFGAGKFVAHASALASFASMGFPRRKCSCT